MPHTTYRLLLIPYSILILSFLYVSIIMEYKKGTKKPWEKLLVLWGIGGIIYIFIELAFRGRSHWTMFLLGGFCFIQLGLENEFLRWDTPIELQAAIGAVVITANELITGLIVNRGFGLNVWDYSGQPYNILGQVCLTFTVAWLGIAIVAIVVDDILRYYFWNEEAPRYTSCILQKSFSLTI